MVSLSLLCFVFSNPGQNPGLRNPLNQRYFVKTIGYLRIWLRCKGLVAAANMVLFLVFSKRTVYTS